MTSVSGIGFSVFHCHMRAGQVVTVTVTVTVTVEQDDVATKKPQGARCTDPGNSSRFHLQSTHHLRIICRTAEIRFMIATAYRNYLPQK